MAEAQPGQGVVLRIRKRWRAWLRAIHRDVGYLAVGLTIIYAVSGIAINHIDDWNPNFVREEKTHQLGPLPADPQLVVPTILERLGIEEEPRDTFVVEGQAEIYFENRTLIAYTDTGEVFDEYERPRFFLRVANWLHYNRGKAAWTYIADAYAVLLLYLAISGMFMLKGKLGLRGRGALLIALGAGVPILYVTLSGGPGG